MNNLAQGQRVCDEVPSQLNRQYVRIKVTIAGICGTDVSKLSGNKLPPGHTHVLGHEFTGQIVETYGETPGFTVGDIVVVMPILACGACPQCILGQENLCREANAIGRTFPGAFAGFVNVPIENLTKIPIGIEHDAYVLADSLAVAIHATNLPSKSLSECNECLVVGDGTIAALIAWFLKQHGVDVRVLGIHPANLEFIASMGIDVTRELDRQDSFDVIYETVGRAQSDTLSVSIEAVRARGSIVVVGVYCQDFVCPIAARTLFIKEATLIGSNAYTASEFRNAIQMIQGHESELAKLISHSFPLSQFDLALDTARNKRGFTMKVVVSPDA